VPFIAKSENNPIINKIVGNVFEMWQCHLLNAYLMISAISQFCILSDKRSSIVKLTFVFIPLNARIDPPLYFLLSMYF